MSERLGACPCLRAVRARRAMASLATASLTTRRRDARENGAQGMRYNSSPSSTQRADVQSSPSLQE